MKRMHLISGFLLILYTFVNILTLTSFPFIHSDEVWLAGLSQTIYTSKTFIITEPFFKLFPRQPHAIKSLFHALQGAFFSIFDYSIDIARLISFGFTLVMLVLIYMYFTYRFRVDSTDFSVQPFGLSKFIPLLSTLVTAVSVQVIYAAHFARQEAIILIFLVGAYIYFDWMYTRGKVRALDGLFLALITGFAMGFHPNSFLVASMIGGLALYGAFTQKRPMSTRSYVKVHFVFIASYIIVTGLIACLYIWVSLVWNRQFLMDYKTFGDSLGVTASLAEKIMNFPLFTYKLFEQISGTYYTPNIRLEMIFFIGLFLLSLILFCFGYKERFKECHKETYNEHSKKGTTGHLKTKSTIIQKRLLLPIWGIGGLTAGLICIGRYNATSIVFYLPFISFMCFNVFVHLLIRKDHKTPLWAFSTAVVLIVIGLGFNTYTSVQNHHLETYSEYIGEITSAISLSTGDLTDVFEKKSDTLPRVLMNLNGGFAFSPDRFLDYRDLAYLESNNMTTEAYLRTYNVDYIVLPEEMDYIYRNQDPWNILYGKMDYYPDLLQVIEEGYTLIHTFESPRYGMRIPRYNDGYPWTVKVYKKNLP